VPSAAGAGVPSAAGAGVPSAAGAGVPSAAGAGVPSAAGAAPPVAVASIEAFIAAAGSGDADWGAAGGVVAAGSQPTISPIASASAEMRFMCVPLCVLHVEVVRGPHQSRDKQSDTRIRRKFPTKRHFLELSKSSESSPSRNRKSAADPSEILIASIDVSNGWPIVVEKSTRVSYPPMNSQSPTENRRLVRLVPSCPHCQIAR